MQTIILTPAAIRKFRSEKSLSQQNLATILNVGLMTVYRWETGKTKPDGTAAAVLATLVSDLTDHENLRTHGPVASGYAIFQLLKDHLERNTKK